jgi:phosphate transport system substrate-binding protein
MIRRRMLPAALVPAVLPLPARAQSFAGAGSTFAAPLMAQWNRAFTTLQGEGGGIADLDGGLDYEPVGSLGGLMRARAGGVEFGASDVPLPPEEVERHNLAQFPVAMGGVAIAARVPGAASGALRLSPALVARIYLGEVTRWNDPAIATLNPDLPLPALPITVLRRQDGSGTTWHFAAWLASASPDWRQRIGVATELAWPVGQGARGNAGLAELLGRTEGGIAYLEAGLAARLGLPVARLENAAGRFVAPDATTLAAAAEGIAWDASRHFFSERAVPRGEAAYPILPSVFVLMPTRPQFSGRARRTIAFFRFALTERAEDARALGYVPLPPAAVAEVARYWRARLGR